MHLGDPLHLLDSDRLDRLSRDLATAAAELGGLRSALRCRAAGLHWHSAGSRAFQAGLQELLAQLGHSGSRLGELAGALRVHQNRAAGRAASLGAAAAAARSPRAALERLARLP
jgi:predicted DNA-binding ribbon-helix-helix protein